MGKEHGISHQKRKSSSDRFFKRIADFWVSLGASGTVWQLTLCVLLGLISIIYVFAHNKFGGTEYVQLNKEQMQTLNNLISNYSDTITERKIRNEKVIGYIKNEYDGELNDLQLEKIKILLEGFKNSEAGNLLKDQKLLSNSFFWLTGNKIFIEAWLWCLVGVLVSLIYYVSIANSKSEDTVVGDDDTGKFNSKEVPSQVAKMFYAPACTIVLILGYHYLSDKNGNMVDISVNKGLIVFSFICGFFSGRVMKFLDRLKELILPIGSATSDPSTDTNETDADKGSKKGVPIDTSGEEVIKLAIKQFSIKHLEGVTGVGRGFRKSGDGKEACLQINVNDEKFIAEYSKPLEVDLGNGKTQSIIPNVVYVGTPETHSGRGGAGIINIGGVNGTGTIGCIVLDNDTKAKHILSCQHVLNHDMNYNTISDPTSIALVDKPADTVAKHVSGMRTHEIDAALAEIISNPNLFDNSNLGIIKGTRDLSTADINETVKVKLTGYDIGLVKVKKNIGLIVNNEFFAQLKYPDGNNFGIEDLIVLSKKEGDKYKPISKPGYSGALVIDENNFAIGLLVGGDGNYSYAIPINKVLAAFNCSILKS